MGTEFIQSWVNNNKCFEDKNIVEACGRFVNNSIYYQEFSWRFIASAQTIARKGKGRWGFKEPRLAYGMLGFILSFFDEFTLIHCVRRREQVIESMMRVFNWKESKCDRLYHHGMGHLKAWLRFIPHLQIDLSDKLTVDEVKGRISEFVEASELLHRHEPVTGFFGLGANRFSPKMLWNGFEQCH
jgi:hypothetical protein